MPRRPRGAGSVVRSGPGWAIRYGPRGAKRFEGGFRTRAEADRRLVILRAEDMNRRLGVAADPKQTPTLSALADSFFDRRKITHAAGAEDFYRWRKHLEPAFGHLRPDDVDAGRIRALVESKRGELAPATLRVVIAVLSSFYEDLLERRLATVNPARRLPRSLLRLVRSDHDPRTVPFIERLADVRRVFLALPEPVNVGFALGAMAGLRPVEAYALRWDAVDLNAGRLVVRMEDAKDKDSRVVPILAPLLPVLKAWHVKSGGRGLVCPPLRCDGERIGKGTRGAYLRRALAETGLARPGLGYYQATRHTFASHWVMAGGSIEKLSAVLGHYSVVMTERYAHLRPELFTSADVPSLDVDLRGSLAHTSALPGVTIHATPRKKKRNAGAAL